MDVSKFDYEIDPEVKEKVNLDNKKTENSQNENDIEKIDFYIVKPKTKKKINIPYFENDIEYERPPKKETYYIVYNNVEFSILAQRIGFLDEFKQIVLENNGMFYNAEDEFFDSRDAEKVVEILKGKFSDNNWFISVLSKAIEEIFKENSSFDDSTFELIKKRFFMLDDETLYEAISYLANK
jgi:hypothetical protein